MRAMRRAKPDLGGSSNSLRASSMSASHPRGQWDLSGEYRISDERIGLPLMSERGHRAVPRHEGGLVAHRPEALGDGADELLLVAALEVPAADGAAEQHIADEREVRFAMMEDD